MESLDRGMNIDSSLSLDTKSISIIEYKERIISLLEPILQSRFPHNPQKQRIKLFHDRITIACPYCGDSMKSDSKKRGNIILAGKFQNFYKCHNCGEFKRVDSFFTDYKVNLDLDVVDYISDHLGDFKSSLTGKYDVSLLLDVDLIEKYAIDRQELIEKLKLVEINDSSVRSWLRSRLQFQEERFLYNKEKNYLLILNLTPSGKILGFQKRGFKLKPYESKYLTYKLSKIRQGFGKEPLDENITNELDSVSQLFNITLLNFSHPITLFEGAMDSFLFKNSISLSGANKSFPLDIPIRYWFDDDETGRRNSIKYIEGENSVFLWERLKKQLNLPYRKKWDLNDVMIWLKENDKSIPLFENYFSDDPLDSIDI